MTSSEQDRNTFAAKHFQDRAQRWTELYLDRDREAHSFLIRRDAVEAQLDRIPRRPGEQAIDVGCGTGPYLPGLAQRAAKAVGMDIAPAMIEEARRNLPAGIDNVELTVASVFDLPMPNDTFDIGVCVGVLEYFDDPVGMLRAVFRVMKPGGSIVFTLPNFFGVSRLSGLPRTVTVLVPPRWKVIIGPKLDRLRGRKPDPSKYYLGASFTPARIRRLCAAADLEVAEITTSGYEELRFAGFASPAKTEFAFARHGEARRERFPWRYLGNNLIVTVRKPERNRG